MYFKHLKMKEKLHHRLHPSLVTIATATKRLPASFKECCVEVTARGFRQDGGSVDISTLKLRRKTLFEPNIQRLLRQLSRCVICYHAT